MHLFNCVRTKVSHFITACACALLLIPILQTNAAANSNTLQTPSLSAAARPNLVPQNITLSTYSARPGDQITVAWTMTNSGSGHCPASFTGLHLGTSSTLPPTSDALNVQLVTPEIPARSSVRQTNVITIPSTLSVGTYYLWVFADDVPNSTLNQTSRADDRARSSALSIATVVIRPNLVPQDVVLSTYMVRPGDQITATWTIRNLGNITCPASTTGLHLGTSATTPPTAGALNLFIATPEIAPQSSISQTNVITLPANLPLGTYYLWVVADDVANSTLNQTSRTDDFARSSALSVVSVITQPNLVPLDITLSTEAARPGDQIIVAWTMTNSGNGNCPASTTGLHLGTSATTPPAADGLNLRIATPAISANSSVRQTNTITLPANTTLGTYYLWVFADDVTTSTLNQTSRADDRARSAAISVVSVIRRPNLIPSNVTLSATTIRPGDQISIAWTMTNSGNGNCPASVTGLHLGASVLGPPSTDGLDLLIPTPAINTNSSVRITNLVTIPANTTFGTYYLWVVADDVDTSTLNQSSRSDDAVRSLALSVTSVIPRPNLIPQNVVLSKYSALPGEEITVAWTTTNSGNGSAPASVSGIYLGTSPTAPPTNDVLNLSVQTAAINANSSVRQTNRVTLTAPVGTYYIWIISDDDPNSTLNQTSRADDFARSPALSLAKAILVSPAPDTTINAPPTFDWTPVAQVFTYAIYIANKPAPLLGVDQLYAVEHGQHLSKYTLSQAQWLAAVNTLGAAPTYYWTMGSTSATRREIYAEWRPVKIAPLAIGGTFLPSTTNFRFQIIAPHQSQVTIQASDGLTNNWTDLGTVPNTTGTVTYTDPAPNTRPRRFYRAKP